MNRRLILLDQEDQNSVKFLGRGLTCEIRTIQELETLSEFDRNKVLELGVSDGVMLVGGGPFKYLQGFYHFGVRNENYADCSELRRLSIEGGSFAKCVLDYPEDSVMADFLSPRFTTPVDFSWFQQKICKTYEDAMRLLNYMASLPKTTHYGFDYEASGMPLDRWFEISGAAICTVKYGGFISFTDIRKTATNDEYGNLIYTLGLFLLDRMDHVWTYNMQYEFQVSHRMLGVDLYNLCDASVFNVLDGKHLKKFSLKWTANRILESTVWDTEFDRISDLIDSMLFEEVGKLKREKRKVLKVTPDNYKQTPEWSEICKRYPGYIGEFESLIQEYWGNPFMCIPSDILGYYCNLDAFYTLMIYEVKKSEYSEDAIRTFMDNIRLGARLHSSGLYIDEPYRLKYEEECLKMMAWGITYCAMARCKLRMDIHKKLMANLSKYNPVCQKLLKKDAFFGGDPVEIVKYILTTNLDKMDAYDTGVNEGSLLIHYGQDFAEKFMDIVRDAMTEVKMKSKIDDGIIRKKKFLGIVSEKIKPILGLDKLKLGKKHEELEKYMYYERGYDELERVVRTQMPNVESIPPSINAFGKKDLGLLEYSDLVSENLFKCKSPIENDKIVTEMFELYKEETSFLGALSESIQQLPGEKKSNYFKDRGLNSIGEAFAHFMKAWEEYCTLPPDKRTFPADYPEKLYIIAGECWNKGIKYEPAKDVKPVKDVWADFTGYNIQAEFFSEYNNQFVEYGIPFEDKDLLDKFFFMRKFTINYLLYKKYSKVLSTYINGMFKANNKWVIEGPDHIPLREADPGEPGAVEKCFVRYEVNTKSSKRWSSGFHTIISHSDLKDCLVTPYHYDEYGNKVTEDFIETYFDIDRVIY